MVVAAIGIPLVYMVWAGDGAKWPNPWKSRL
jgi:hypothetical protein